MFISVEKLIDMAVSSVTKVSSTHMPHVKHTVYDRTEHPAEPTFKRGESLRSAAVNEILAVIRR